jgi:hypothetical protein
MLVEAAVLVRSVEMEMMALKLLATEEMELQTLLQAHLLLTLAVAAVAHRDKLPAQAKVVAVTEQIIILLLLLVLPILAVAVEVVDMQAVLEVQVAQVVQA